ncbi:MAG TPA: tRNA epoxyqueuosine(34) reductase QueG [Phycisphaerae bacterium]|nr:tRNA epoxyqueuosine(34) reductase QueG [Phycisphaerae bacterium]
MTRQERSELVCSLARQAGFDAVGIAPAAPIARRAYFHDWLDRGCHGEMAYLSRTAEVRTDPRRLLEGAHSVIVVAQSYKPAEEQRAVEASTAADGLKPIPKPEKHHRRDLSACVHAQADAGAARFRNGLLGPRGRVARYAWGRDYHRVLRKKLHRLTDAIRAEMGEPFDARVCVDTAPIIERELAAAAGVGWIGKNTLVLHPKLGSYFFLGEIVTTLELAPSAPMTDHCGSCTRCLEVCPTQAFPGPYRMDATRCISYLTIEHRGEIAPQLQLRMGDWVFGCDICQEACPYNRKAPARTESVCGISERFPLAPRPLLETILNLTEEQRRQCLSGSAMKRATPDMLKRNAAIAMKNVKEM